MNKLKKTYEHWRIPIYLVMILLGIICFLLTIFITSEYNPFMYVFGTLVSFFANIKLNNIIERSINFIIFYFLLTVISSIISYFLFDNYQFEGPRGLAFYVMMLGFSIYIVISIYDKILGIDISDYSSDNNEG